MEEMRDEGVLRYHYKRSERLAKTTITRGCDPTGGAFFRNRVLTIMLADIVVLAILGFIFFRVLDPNPATFEGVGYRLRLSAAPKGDVVDASLFVEAVGDGRPGEVIHVVFAMEGGADEVEVYDSLPVGNDESLWVRAPLPRGNGTQVEARFTIGERSGRLRYQLPR